MIHLQCIGLLHSDICGSFRACRSPQLFAAYRVLLRLPMPRHSPCALFSLTFAYGISSVGRNYAFFSWNLFFDCSIFLPRFFCAFNYYYLKFSSLHLLLLYSVFKVLFSGILSSSSDQASFLPTFYSSAWWAQMDSNHRPHAYQACALTT